MVLGSVLLSRSNGRRSPLSPLTLPASVNWHQTPGLVLYLAYGNVMNLLFICSKNRLRIPTAEQVFAD
jgi:hypothetical protein